MKTSELTGAALDWAVATCEIGDAIDYVWKHAKKHHSYSTDWAQGGPIIEREKIDVTVSESGDEWNAQYRFKRVQDDAYWSGQTPLIAAMRCYVASKLGDEVEIPEELK